MGTVALQEVKVQGAGAGNGRAKLPTEAAFLRQVDGAQTGKQPYAEPMEALDSTGEDANGAARPLRITLEWRDLRYTVPLGVRRICCMRRSNGERVILEGLSAVMPPGRLLAVMGPTGCGKSSFVNALAGRLPAGGTLEGQVLVNGLQRGKGFRAVSAYVMQDDVLFHNLTVRETLHFAARMRLPSTVPPAAKAARVDAIIAQLGLAGAANTQIGNAFVRGVSGGERKRVNIAVELLANPSLIFADEATSGLDAFQAQSVMESLSQLAKSGRSVLATIHQPRSSVFQLFDLLMVLSEGQMLYYGPAAEAVAWFASCGFHCPEHYNPADFFADLVARDRRTPDADATSQQRIKLLVARFKEHHAEGSTEEGAVPQADELAMQRVNERPPFPNRWPVEFGLLLKRAWKQQSRDRLPQIITLMQTLVLGFVLAALFSDVPKTAQGVQDELGVLFMCCMFSAMASLFASLNTFPAEAGIVNRERAGKSYHVLPYYLARFICDMPLRVGQGLLFGVIVYFIVGLNPAAAAFFQFVELTILEGLASQALGVAVSAAAKTEKIAFAVAPGVTVVLMLFGGFFVSTDSIPASIRWITYISHLYYAFQGLVINNFAGRTGWTCASPQDPTCTITGDQIIDKLGFGDKPRWEAYVGLSCLILGYNMVGYAVLRFSKQKFLPLSPAAGKKRA
ncbi:hypothetical protein ABPG75_009769 [Micractinium tetrahymenae]